MTQIAISLRMNRNKEKNKDAKFYIKLKATIRMLAIIFINMAIIYEQQDNYERTLESYKYNYQAKFNPLESDSGSLPNSSLQMKKFTKLLKSSILMQGKRYLKINKYLIE